MTVRAEDQEGLRHPYPVEGAAIRGRWEGAPLAPAATSPVAARLAYHAQRRAVMLDARSPTVTVTADFRVLSAMLELSPAEETPWRDGLGSDPIGRDAEAEQPRGGSANHP